MAQELYANDASTTVAAAAGGNSGTETWVVASSASFPAASNVANPPTQFHVADPAAPSELILVTNVNGTTWSVTRGAESTIPVPHSAGYTIAQVLTAGDLTALATYTGDVSLVSGVTEVTSTSLTAPLPVTQGGIGVASTTAYAVVTGGTASTAPLQQVASLGTSGQVLTSNGPGTLPSFQPATGGSSVTFPVTVPEGGTGGTQATTYALVTGGTSATSPFQQVSGVGSSGNVLTSNGAAALPTWQANVGFSNPMSALGDMISGGASGAAARLVGNTSATKEFLTSTGNGATAAAPQWGTIAASDVPVLNQNTTGTSANVSGTVAVINGGTGLGSLSTFAIVAGGTASTTPVQQIAAGTAGTVLTGNGAGTLPSFQVLPAGTTSASGILQLDGTAADIQPLGTQAAGSGTLTAISTHVHPSPSLGPSATDQGFKAWTSDPISSLSAVSPTAGVLYLARIAVQSVITVGTISTFALGAASGATSQAATFVSLFNASGTTRYGVSGDISSSFSSTGLISAPISGTLTPGYYYAAFLMGTAATTASKLSAFAGGVSVPGYPSLNLTAATARWASQGAGLVAMPGTVNMASNSLTMSSLNTYFWFAIS